MQTNLNKCLYVNDKQNEGRDATKKKKKKIQIVSRIRSKNNKSAYTSQKLR